MNAAVDPAGARLAETLAAELPQIERLLIAFSGGLDSRVLLHRLASDAGLRGRYALQAVHVDHQLQAASGAWAGQCAAVCQALAVPLQTLRITVRPAPGISLEAAARQARYGVLAALMDARTALVTAHHQGDQAETVLLALLRGAGPRGLAAMPWLARFATGWLWRPLLDYSRSALLAYARRHDLRWLDDPSNADTRFARNYLRHRVLPELHRRWPAAERVLARAAGQCAEASALLDELATLDYQRVAAAAELSVSRLRELGPARQRNLLRRWLRGRGLPVPGSAVLERIITDGVAVSRDRRPLIHWPGGEVRRYRDRLYALAPLAPVPERSLCLPWSGQQPLDLPDGGRLHRVAAAGPGLPAALDGLCVRFRQGGERFRPAGRGHSQQLKKLLQEAGLPPWERDRLPLIYWCERLVAVPGVGVDAALAGGSGWIPQWQKPTNSVTL